MELHVIDSSSSHYPNVLQLRNRILRVPLGLNLFDEDLDGEQDEATVVLLRDTELIACIMLKKLSDKEVKLRQMAVDLPYQRKGHGSVLMAYTENFCHLNDISHLILHARQTAVPFYQRLGYTVCSETFEEVGIPHVKMEKYLRNRYEEEQSA